MKRKKYYFCEGMNGIVVAHDLKHAIKLLSKYFNNTKQERQKFYKELTKELKAQEKLYYIPYYKFDWFVETENCNEKGKSRVIGWCE